MAKPYFLFKKSNGYYYAQLLLPDGTRSYNKSTGTKNRADAEKTVMGWVVNGNIPIRTNAANSKIVTSTDKIRFMNDLRTFEFADTEIDMIIKILKDRKLISSAVKEFVAESRPVEEFLEHFWDFDSSPYVKEKLLRGHSIHKSYCETMKSRIFLYWIPRFRGRSVGSITRDDVKAIFEDDTILMLAPKTINSIVSSLTIAMKWAFFNGLTVNNCYDGILKCANRSKKRKILNMEQAAAIFSIEWENDAAKLANAVAMYTGMRQGEIAALRVEDIGTDRLYVRNSWSKYEGLKCCKNGETREVPIPLKLRDDLLSLASLNPYEEGLHSFVFFGLKPSQPTDPKNWLKYLHRALAQIGYSNPKDICFHAWRHLWCSRIADIIADKRVIMSGSGHKTETMLNHYAEHLEEENAMHKLKDAADRLFLPMIEQVM